MGIPKLIHLIWLGQKLPEPYYNNILEWANLNPELQIWLWLDSLGDNFNRMHGKGFQAASEITKGQFSIVSRPNIHLKDIKNLTIARHDAFYWHCVRYEIDRLRSNYGAASDLLRLAILGEYGGAYYDTDIKPLRIEHLDFWDKEPKSFHMHRKSCNDILITDKDNTFLINIKNTLESNYALIKSTKQTMIDEHETPPAQFSRLILKTYLSDSPFFINSNTLNQSGPNTFPGTQGFEKILEDRALRRSHHQESDQTWCARPLKQTDQAYRETVGNRILDMITFEMDNFAILRTSDHLKNLNETLGLAQNKTESESISANFLKKLEAVIVHTKLKVVQLTFADPKITRLYKKLGLMSRTALLPWDLRFIGDKNNAYLDLLRNLGDIPVINPSILFSIYRHTKICCQEARNTSLARLAVDLEDTLVKSIFPPTISRFMEFSAHYLREPNLKLENLSTLLSNLETLLTSRIKFFTLYKATVEQEFQEIGHFMTLLKSHIRLNELLLEELNQLYRQSEQPHGAHHALVIKDYEELYGQEGKELILTEDEVNELPANFLEDPKISTVNLDHIVQEIRAHHTISRRKLLI